MFVFNTIIGQQWQGHKAQPQTVCAMPAARINVAVANKGNEDTLLS